MEIIKTYKEESKELILGNSLSQSIKVNLGKIERSAEGVMSIQVRIRASTNFYKRNEKGIVFDVQEIFIIDEKAIVRVFPDEEVDVLNLSDSATETLRDFYERQEDGADSLFLILDEIEDAVANADILKLKRIELMQEMNDAKLRLRNLECTIDFS